MHFQFPESQVVLVARGARLVKTPKDIARIVGALRSNSDQVNNKNTITMTYSVTCTRQIYPNKNWIKIYLNYPKIAVHSDGFSLFGIGSSVGTSWFALG